MRRSLIILLIGIAGIASATQQFNFLGAAYGAPPEPSQTAKIGKIVISGADRWVRVGETIQLDIQTFDEHDQPIPTPTLQYVIRRPPKGALGGNRPELVSIDASTRSITGLLAGVTAIRAVDPNVTERGQVNSNELTVVVLPQADTAQHAPDILVAGYVKVNGGYFDNQPEITLTSPSGQVQRLIAGPNGYFHFGWGNHLGKVLTASYAGYEFQSQVIDGREYYIINGSPLTNSRDTK